MISATMVCLQWKSDERGETLLDKDWALIFTMFIAHKVFCKIILNSKYTASDFGKNPESKVIEIKQNQMPPTSYKTESEFCKF